MKGELIMWLIIAIVLLVASFINGDVNMLMASGVFVIAGEISMLMRRK